MSRQSSVRKITRADVAAIADGCEVSDYVIVRYKGKEHGIIDVQGLHGTTWHGDIVYLPHCTVRRQTVESLLACRKHGFTIEVLTHAGWIATGAVFATYRDTVKNEYAVTKGYSWSRFRKLSSFDSAADDRYASYT